MAYCAACGTQVEGKFCSKCGAAVAQPQPAAGGYQAPGPSAYQQQPQYQQPQYQGQPQAAPMGGSQAAGLEENVACALCYALGLLTGVVFLVLAPYNQNKLIRFHAFQSIFFHAGLIVVYIVALILSFVLVFIPVLGHILILLIYLALGLTAFGGWIFLMYKAYNREKFVIPVIGPIAEKQA